jgi:hypothetical protein
VKTATPTPTSRTAATARRMAEGHESAMDASSRFRQGLSLPQSSPPSAQPPALPRARRPTTAAAPARFASPDLRSPPPPTSCAGGWPRTPSCRGGSSYARARGSEMGVTCRIWSRAEASRRARVAWRVLGFGRWRRAEREGAASRARVRFALLAPTAVTGPRLRWARRALATNRCDARCDPGSRAAGEGGGWQVYTIKKKRVGKRVDRVVPSCQTGVCLVYNYQLI